MSDYFASGSWHVHPGQEEEFVDRWSAFLQWTRKSQPALERAALIRDQNDPKHFVSWAEFSDREGRDAWKRGDEFMELFSACRELCDDFYGSDYERAAAI